MGFVPRARRLPRRLVSRGPHDLGGLAAGPVARDETRMPFWARRLEAMRDCLARRAPPGMRVDEMRRAIEELDPVTYDKLTVYERKAQAIGGVLRDRGLLDGPDLERRIAALRERCAAETRSGHDHD